MTYGNGTLPITSNPFLKPTAIDGYDYVTQYGGVGHEGFLLFTMTGPIVLYSPLQNDDTIIDRQVEIPLSYIGIFNLP